MIWLFVAAGLWILIAVVTLWVQHRLHRRHVAQLHLQDQQRQSQLEQLSRSEARRMATERMLRDRRHPQYRAAARRGNPAPLPRDMT